MIKRLSLLLTTLIAFSNSFCQSIDLDNDGLEDAVEDSLANKYAPVIIHADNEKYYPTNVDAYLKNSSLWLYDDECDPIPDFRGDVHDLIIQSPKQEELINKVYDKNCCGSNQIIFSNRTLSDKKQRTFYLRDVSEDLKHGDADPKQWTTYYHSYKNDINGVTIQYWRIYAFNGFPPIDFVPENFRQRISKLRACCHGGDWECVQVILDSNLTPVKVRFTGHEHLTETNWIDILKKDATHPLIYSVVEGHTSIPATGNEKGIIQEIFTNGKVYYPNGDIKQTGTLMNVGEKCSPLNGQVFIQYAGLWGSPGTFYETSGYFGPAFNETDMNKQNHFISAWCIDMQNKEKVCGEIRECYPTTISR